MGFLFTIIFIIATWQSVQVVGRNSERIVGGVDTTVEEVPWQITIHYYRIHQCGGAVVNENTIITAAHCFEVQDFDTYPEAFTVRAGTSRRSVGGEIYQSEKITRHPKFNISNYNYDIAIIKLTTNLKFSAQVQPIALPEFNEPIPVGAEALVTGWGRLSYDGYFPKFLQKVYLPVLNQTQCKEIYEDLNPIRDHMFCAGTCDGKMDACKGDSGGPVVVNKKLVGVISWGIECALPEYPGVFTSVSVLRKWIDENMD